MTHFLAFCRTIYFVISLVNSDYHIAPSTTSTSTHPPYPTPPPIKPTYPPYPSPPPIKPTFPPYPSPPPIKPTYPPYPSPPPIKPTFPPYPSPPPVSDMCCECLQSNYNTPGCAADPACEALVCETYGMKRCCSWRWGKPCAYAA
eukprot:122312_1